MAFIRCGLPLVCCFEAVLGFRQPRPEPLREQVSLGGHSAVMRTAVHSLLLCADRMRHLVGPLAARQSENVSVRG